MNGVSTKWRLEGRDTFEGEEAFYPILSECDSEEEANVVARRFLAYLEETQSNSSSGGQESGGAQGRIYIVGPDGKRRRFLG